MADLSSTPAAGFQDNFREKAGSLLPSFTCGGERGLGQGHQESHYVPTRREEVCQEVHETLYSPAG